jgi:hypothetical protein
MEIMTPEDARRRLEGWSDVSLIGSFRAGEIRDLLRLITTLKARVAALEAGLRKLKDDILDEHDGSVVIPARDLIDARLAGDGGEAK